MRLYQVVNGVVTMVRNNKTAISKAKKVVKKDFISKARCLIIQEDFARKTIT